MVSQRSTRNRRSARSQQARAPKRRLLVVCEGEVTEPEYLRGYEHAHRNATLQIEIPQEHGDPKHVVEVAKQLKQQASADAKRQRDSFLKFDEVWCVFDRDAHNRFDDACTMAKDNGLSLAVSNPCIELWLLLHFRESPGARSRQVVQSLLKKELPHYSKHVRFDLLAASVTKATGRARRLDADAEARGEPMHNPSTSFYKLIDSIKKG